MLLSLALVACPCGTSCSGCSGWGDPCKDDTGIVLADEHNYALDVSMELEVLTAAPWTDLEVCWDDLSADLHGEELHPLEEVVEVEVVRFDDLSAEEVLDKLVGCGLRQADVSGHVNADIGVPSDGCIRLSELDFLGTSMDPTEEMDPDASYLLIFYARGALAWLALLELDEDSAVTELHLDPDAGAVLADADLVDTTPIPFVPSCSSWVDWTGLQAGAGTCELKLSDIERLRLGRFDIGRAELEEAFPSLEQQALELWEADVDGLPGFDLVDLPASDLGQAFEHLDPSYTWVLALDCDSCSTSLAPVFLGVFEGGTDGSAGGATSAGSGEAGSGDEDGSSRDACD